MKHITGSKLNRVLAIALAICLLGGTTDAYAQMISGDIPLGGASYYINLFNNKNKEDDAYVSLLAEPVTIPDNVAIAKVNEYVNIRSGAGTTYGVVGYLPKNGMCVVLDQSDGWAKIESGNVSGYVSTDYLYTGEEGRKKAEELACLMATVNANTVNFRSEPNTSTGDNILATVTRGEALKVIEETVVNKEDSTKLWVKAYVDDMEGYISKDLVVVAYDWTKAVSMSSIVGPNAAANLSSLRSSIIIEAKKHIGLKYVWGGNSLTTGCDCSGFVVQVYKKCGIDTSNLPRTSYDMASSKRGVSVKLANAKPGDLVFYGDSKGNVNHVAIYLGNEQIIHESGKVYGCRVSSVYYRTILKVKNFID